MRIVGFLALLAGLALMAFLVFHAGIGPIASALSILGFWGLATVALVHFPIIGLLGVSWWLVGRTVRLASWTSFIWARAVRDAAAEALPFSQLGGYVIGARALTSHSLNVHAGHDDVMSCADTGWGILFGRNPQEIKQVLWAGLVAATLGLAGVLAHLGSAAIWRAIVHEPPPTSKA